MPQLKAPTIKQKRFVKEYLRTGSKVKAADLAYDTKDAHNLAQKVWQSQGVQLLIKEAMRKEGLTEDTIAHDLKDLKDKTKPTSPVSDPRLHLDTLKEINKIQGFYAPEKKTIDKRTMSLKGDLSQKTTKEQLQILNDIKKEIGTFTKMIENGKANVL